MKSMIVDRTRLFQRSKVTTITILFISFLLSSTNLFSQKLIDDTRTIKVLIFEHEQKDKKKMISQTGRIKYKLRSDPKKVHKGTLDDIKEGAMIVDGQEIAFKDCVMIGGRVSSQELLVGGICAGAGFSGIVLGAVMLGNITLGGTVIAIGVAAIVVGIFLISKIKRFNLDKGWAVYSGKIEYSPTDG